jgi:hypothetical protein
LEDGEEELMNHEKHELHEAMSPFVQFWRAERAHQWRFAPNPPSQRAKRFV